jgi:hypothetical protein
MGQLKEWTFLHEESGSQRMHTFGSPGGIDVPVLNYLMANDVKYVYHVDKKNKITYVATVDLILIKGIVRAYGGRQRVFLPEGYWAVEYGLPPKTAYIPDEITVGSPPLPTLLQPALPGMEE